MKKLARWLNIHNRLHRSLNHWSLPICTFGKPWTEYGKRFNGIHQFILEGAEKKNHMITRIIFRATNLKNLVMLKTMQTLNQI